MPPRKRPYTKSTTSKPKSNDFVVDSDDDDNSAAETQSKPQSKKSKTSKDDSSAVATKSKSGASGKVSAGIGRQVDAEGNPYWEMGGKLRRITLSKFKGNVFVNIREHYEKDGAVLPGKKGISLSIDQFNALMTALPDLHKELGTLADKPIVMPKFGGKEGPPEPALVGKESEKEEEEDEDEEDDDEEEE